MSEPVLSPTALKIIVTAKRLFMQRGYRAVSVNDIVHQAEITKPTLYYHFTDKEELFVQMALHTLEAMHERMERAVADRETTAERLAAIADVTLKSPDGNFRMMRHDIRENLSPAQQRIALAFYQKMVDPLEREMARGLERGELTRHTPRELVWLFMGFLEGFHNDPAEVESDTYTSGHNAFPTPMLIDLFLHGAGPIRPI
jgi:AcrR family transcriptional regulator